MPGLAGILIAIGAALTGGGGVDEHRAARAPDPPAAAGKAPPAAPNSAPRLIFWVNCEDVLGLNNRELDEWKAAGVDGFVCMTNHLRGLGGSQAFTGDPEARLRGKEYKLQRELHDSRVGRRAAARGIKLYLGAYLVNYYNRATPLAEWFAPTWSKKVLPRLSDLAGAARLLGFAGVAFDQELYPQEGSVTKASWGWDHPGNVRTEDQVREQARRRGAQVMRSIVRAFPKAEIGAYFSVFPGDWSELVQEVINGVANTSTDRVDVDFWNGMTSVPGYRAIRFFDATFYKTPHVGTWDNALTYLQNRTYATFSQRFSNWDYAWSRVHVAPFAWLDEGPNPTTFDDPQEVEYVAEQLLAFRKWSAGGEFANFAYSELEDFDYSPYLEAMRAASAAADDDGGRPTLNVTEVSDGDGSTLLLGTAGDDLAIRAVRWRDDRGRAGVAALEWEVLAGDYRTGYTWQTRWSIDTRAFARGAAKITIKAVDISGRRSGVATVRSPR